MEQSPVIANGESEFQKSAPEEVQVSNPGKQEQTLKVSEGKEVESVEDSQVPDKEKAKESVQNFKNALVDIWLLVTPYLLSCRVIKPMAEDSVDLAVYVARKLDSFSSKYETIQDVKLLDLVELVRTCAFEGLEFFKSDEFEQIVTKYLVHCHMMVLETLDYAAELMELVSPSVAGVKPLFELDAAELSIRKKSFYLIANFFYRSIQKTVAHVVDVCTQLSVFISAYSLPGIYVVKK